MWEEYITVNHENEQFDIYRMMSVDGTTHSIGGHRRKKKKK